MAVLDADRVLLAVNAAMTDTLGYAADQMIGRRADVFLSPDDWSRADAEWSHLFARALPRDELLGHLNASGWSSGQGDLSRTEGDVPGPASGSGRGDGSWRSASACAPCCGRA